MLILILFSLSFLWSVPSLDIIELAMDLSSKIYAGNEDDFSYLDGRGGIQLINEPQHSFIPKFSLWQTPDNVLFLIIRGSENLEDWADDLEFVEIENETLGAHFHSGFWAAAEGVWNQVADVVKRLNLPLYITGHSLGASTSEILHIIGRRDILDAGLPVNIETIAFAPVPAMSKEGDVVISEPHITVFVHNRDIVPLLCVKKFAELAYAICELFDPLEFTDICAVIENKDIDDLFNQYVHIDTVVGGNIFWLRYDCTFLDFDCHVKTDLKDAWSSSEELEEFDIDRLSILNGTAFDDHGQSHYYNYITQITQFSSARARSLAPSPATPPRRPRQRKQWWW